MLRRPAYATGAQISYLRRLLARAFALRIQTVYIRDWDRLLLREASSLISEIKGKIEAAEAVKA